MTASPRVDTVGPRYLARSSIVTGDRSSTVRTVSAGISASSPRINVPAPAPISPPMAARFSLTMLSNTPEGDAYTFSELRRMLLDAGFRETTLHALPGAHSVVLGVK